jgi:hypothetical protein
VASFDAGTVIEALDYTLEPFVPGRKGTIREPTSVQVQAFLTANAKEMQRLRKEAGVEPPAGDGAAGEVQAADADPEMISDELLAKLAAVDPKKVEAAQRRGARIYADLCSGEPSAEDLMKLPHRIMLKFAEWLMGEVMSPEAVTGAGRPHLTAVPSSAAG